jgi:hypothetical protein
MENILNKKIMAFVPEYVENRGNCTTIYTKENEPIILDRHIKTFIKNICKYYMIDLTATRKRYSKLVISPNMMPIPLSKHDIFIPFKTRVPLAKNDGSLGYVNMRYIKNLSDGDGVNVKMNMNKRGCGQKFGLFLCNKTKFLSILIRAKSTQ